MAELIVVSAIVLVVLGTFYVSYNKIYSAYQTRIDYHDSNALYRLAYFRDKLIEDGTIHSKLNAANSNIVNIYSGEYDSYNEKIFLINNKKKSISNTILNGQSGINQTYKDYVTFLSDSVSLASNYVMIIERCEKSNKDKCTYEYLEVYDGKE